MIKDFSLLCLIVLGQLFSVATYAEEIRDYYSEPGLNPFKGDAGDTANESIDPFSGALQIVHQDLKVPGNGGLDINVNRVYNHFTGGGTPAPNPMGMGWSMHFGRIVFSDVDKVCSQNLWSVSTIDNPSLEFSDGRRELLVLSSIGGYLVSKSSWRMDCVGGYPRVYSPEGTVYVMDELSGSANAYYVSRITDVHGNYLSISYYAGDASNNFLVPSSVTSSDGRLVSFSYANGMLSSINSNGQKWTYSYTPVIGTSGVKNLVSATRPDGLKWEYQYFPVTGEWFEPSASMSFIKYPRGATVTYNYQAVAFYPGDDPRWAIESKVANDGVNTYSWNYVFQPGSEIINTREFDLTIIQTPYGTEEYLHYGTHYAIGYIDALWRVGLLAEKKISSGGVVKRKETFNWGKREISEENYWHGKDLNAIDEYVYAPILLAKGVEVDGFGAATYFSGYDSFGNPAKIDYKSNTGTIPDRVVSYTYSNNTSRWILGKVLTEVIREGDGGTAIRSTNNSYNANGDLILSDTNGVIYEYSYTSEGDLRTVLDPNNKIVTYGEYFRGLPQLEVYPEGVSLARTVNDSGTVASQTDGNGNSTSFSYDALNRLTAINYPIGTNVAITYSANGQSLTRGIYSESISYDGFGNQTHTSRSGINISKTYDAYGRVLTETLPGYSSKITYEYDILGRVTLKKNPDNTSLTYVYTEPYTTITDENGHDTTIQYLYWGDHNNGRDAIAITTELNQTLQYRNVLGQLDYVWQGEAGGLGFTRSFTYDARGYLASEDHPDLAGNILYTRDDMGNLLSKKVEGEPALNYSYDDLGRLLNIDYPDPSSDVSYQYDNNSNILVIGNANSIRTSSYDQLNQLVQETVDIDGTSYTTSYDYNGLGYLSRVTYPSSRTVDYFPDELGRPTKALPYVDVAAYYPSGNLQRLQFANGVLETFSEDIRLFLSNSTLAASGFLGTSSYYHDGKGNLTAFNTVSDNIALESSTFSYDALDRLISYTDALAWSVKPINYDYMGNITEKEGKNYSYSGVMLSKIITPSSLSLQRWISHDSYGNVSNNDLVEIDVVTGLPEVVRESRQYVYDHAGNMTHANYAHFDGNTTSFGPDFYAAYDGLNNRVNKIRNGESTDFLYSANGLLTGEYQNGELAFGKENFYLGRKLIASVKANKPPVVNAGIDQQVPGGSTVYLNGLAADDGGIASYQWQQTAGLVVSLSGSGNTVSFTAPNSAEVLEFLLEATDEHGDVGGDTLTITSALNETPVATISSIQTVIEGVPFVLNGSESTDDGGIVSFLWERTTSPATASVNIDNPTAAITNVTIEPGAQANFTETFSLSVSDSGGLADSTAVTVQVISLLSDNDADQLKDYWEVTYFGDTQSNTGADDPDADGFSNVEEFINGTDPTIPEPVQIVNAGPDIIVFPGEVFNLKATAVDTEWFSSLTWYGPADKKSLSGSTTANRYFSLDLFDTDLLGYSLWTEDWEVRVTNSEGTQESDFVTIALINPAIDFDNDSLPDGWETFYFGDIASNSGAEDVDGDGLTEVEEYQLRLNPNISDSVPEPIADFRGYAGNGENKLYWQSGGYEKNFDLYWSNMPITDVTTATLISNVVSPYSHTNLSNGSPYYYQVVSKNSANTSTPSPDIMLTPSQSQWQGESLISNSETYFYSESNGYRIYAWVENMEETTGYYHLPARFKLYAKVFSLKSGWGETLLVRDSEFYPQEAKITISEQGYISLAVRYEGRKVGGTLADEVSFHALSLDKARWVSHGKFTLPDNSELSISAPKIALDGRVYYGAFWTKGAPFSPRAYLVTGKISNLASGSWSASYPITINPDGTQLFSPEIEIELGANNSVHVVWAEHQSGGYTMYATLFDTVANTLGANTLIRSSNGSFGGFRMLANSNSDVALLFYEAANGYLKAKSIYYDSNAGTWGSITSVPAPKGGKTSVKFITASKLQSGLIYASLVKGVEVYTLTSDFAGNWSAPVILPIVEKDALNMEESSPDNMLICSRESTGIKITQHNLQTDQLTELDTGLFVSDSDAGFGCAKGLFGDDINVAYSNDGGLYLNQFKAPANEALNTAPISNAGVDIAILPGETAALVGSGQDAEDSNLIYNWYQTGGPGASFIGSSIPSSSPSVNIFYGQFPSDGNYRVTLRTTDPYGVYSEDEMIISVNVNAPPIADAGPDQIIDPGITATLDGSTSSDPGGTIVSYQWTQLTGTAVTLINASAATASFDTVGLSAAEVLTFELSVTDDGGLVSTDATTVTMTSPNQPPIADAGPDTNVNLGVTAVLDGSNSSDSDGTIVTYQWQQLSGTPVTLQNATSAVASFDTTGLVGGELLTFELRVTDNNGAIATDQIALTIVSDTIAPVTTLQSTRYKSKGKTYFDLTLTPNESASSYFRVTGDGNVTAGGSDTTAWQTYTDPITVKLAGNSAIVTFEYYSEDTAGNTEVTQQEILQ